MNDDCLDILFNNILEQNYFYAYNLACNMYVCVDTSFSLFCGRYTYNRICSFIGFI